MFARVSGLVASVAGMNARLRWILSVALLIVSAAAVSGAQTPKPGVTRGIGVTARQKTYTFDDLYTSSHALIIGVSRYTNWTPLPGVLEDVEEVRLALQRHGFKTQVVLDPTSSTFDSIVKSFITEFGLAPRARLLIYYAGHGYSLVTPHGAISYLVPVDAPQPDMVDESGKLVSTSKFVMAAFNMARVLEYAGDIHSNHVLFVFDSCFSGGVFETTRGFSQPDFEKISLPVREFLSAGKANEPVMDNSIFRREFVTGINGAADADHDGTITGWELWRHISRTVPKGTNFRQTPQFDKMANPRLNKGEFLFFVPGQAAGGVAPAAAATLEPPPTGSGYADQGVVMSIDLTLRKILVETLQRRTLRLVGSSATTITGAAARKSIDHLKLGDRIRFTASGSDADGYLQLVSIEVISLAPSRDADDYW